MQAFSMFKSRHCPRPKLRLQTSASSGSLRFTQFSLSHRQANRKFIETCDVGEVRLQHRKKMTSMLEDIKSNQRRAFLSDGFTFSRKQRHSLWNFKLNAEISAKNRSNHDLCCAAGNSWAENSDWHLGQTKTSFSSH